MAKVPPNDMQATDKADYSDQTEPRETEAPREPKTVEQELAIFGEHFPALAGLLGKAIKFFN